jgi:hypothetical protein
MLGEQPDAILANEERFLERLGIGEDACRFLKSADKLELFLGTAGVASGGVVITSSSVVATTFFPSTGVLAWLGLGAVATTPMGWVLAGGALTGGAYYGLRWTLHKLRKKSTVERPKFINTPVDVIANQLLGLMLPLSIWIARSDDEDVSGEERESIVSYYSDEWGYKADFVECATTQCSGKVSGRTAKELAKSLSAYCTDSPDCNKEGIIKFLVCHLREFVATEGNHDSRERKSRAVNDLDTEFTRRTGWWSRRARTGFRTARRTLGGPR